MSFKITMDQYIEWEEYRWFPFVDKDANGTPVNRDNKDNRYGQKFINDHRMYWGESRGIPAFIHSDPGLFYTENWEECRKMVLEKYVEQGNTE